MGNNNSGIYDPQTQAQLTSMPEDILIILISQISTRDFLNLSMTCKYYYNRFIGGNNALWAQICRNIGGITKVLKAIQNGHNVVLNPNLAQLTDESDFLDKNALNGFDFHKAVLDYYMHVVHKSSLFTMVSEINSETTNKHLPKIEIHPLSVWTSFGQYFTRADTKGNNYIKDYYYIVDLQADPESVESAASSLIAQQLPSTIGGRLIYYKKSKTRVEAKRNYFDRSEFLEPIMLDLNHDIHNREEK